MGLTIAREEIKMDLRCFLVAGFLLIATGAVAGTTEYQIIHSSHVAGEPACMPAMTKAPNGDILVACSTMWEPIPWGGYVKLIVSKDNGRTWNEPRIILKDKDPRVSYQVANGLQTLSNGDILMPVTYGLVPKYKDVDPKEQRPHNIYNFKDPGYRREVRLLRSKDNGKTWTVEIPDNLPKPWWRFGRLLEPGDGRLIMPGRGWYIESRDFGKTWGPKISLNTWFWRETNIVKAGNGTFFAILLNKDRHPMRVFGTTRSEDGKTWNGEWQLTGVRGKMPDLLVLPSGRILFAVGAEGLTDGAQIFTTPNRRSFCNLFISDDNGLSWKRDVAFQPVDAKTTIVPGDSPVMCALGNGNILVVMQGIDQAKKDHPRATYDVGMHLIGNVIEPVSR